jgi:tetratricopeptide (TPR) repeat protein
VVWLHAGLVEVYAPNVACIALLAWLLLRERPSLQLAAFLSGLGLGAHATFVLSALGLWTLVWIRHRDARRIVSLWPWVVLGAGIIGFLPAAASRDPWLNWGDPSSLSSLIDHLTAAGIRSSFATEMGVGASANAAALKSWASLASGSAPWLLLMILGGLLREHRTALSRAALLLLAVDVTFSVFLNPMGQADLQTGVPGAWALGLGAASLVGDPRLQGARRALWTGVALLALVWVGSDRIEDRAGDEVAGVWSRLSLGQAPPGSLVLVSSDHLASQSLYLEGIEGFRPDLMTLVKQHMPDDALVRRRYEKEGERLPAAALEIPPEALQRRVYALAAIEAARRPVLWELGDGRLDGPVSDRLRPDGALYRLGGFGAPVSASEDADWLPSRVSRLAQKHSLAFRSRRVLSDSLRLRGVWHLLRQESDLGARVLQGAVTLDPTHAPSLLNLAAARFRQGDRQEAIQLLERALLVDPTYAKARENIQRYKDSEPADSP